MTTVPAANRLPALVVVDENAEYVVQPPTVPTKPTIRAVTSSLRVVVICPPVRGRTRRCGPWRCRHRRGASEGAGHDGSGSIPTYHPGGDTRPRMTSSP